VQKRGISLMGSRKRRSPFAMMAAFHFPPRRIGELVRPGLVAIVDAAGHRVAEGPCPRALAAESDPQFLERGAHSDLLDADRLLRAPRVSLHGLKHTPRSPAPGRVEAMASRSYRRNLNGISALPAYCDHRPRKRGHPANSIKTDVIYASFFQ
jgi:hypothetical protein